MESTAQTSSESLADQPSAIPEGEKEALEAIAAAFQSPKTDAPNLYDRISELEEEVLAWKDRAMRAVADAENIRRRAEKEQQDMSKYAITNFARDLISVAENLARASTSISSEARSANEQVDNLAMGVDMTLQELQSVFGKHHIRRIDPMGEPFDHNYHQAMTKFETTEHPAGTVIQVVQAAYVLHDRLLRPAMVVIAAEPKTPTTGATDHATSHVDRQI
ncbi:MAG: nucleotide exchange factor GrpE [Alphaproteobacteria bacterium]|nr:MAG: nucleotide exchange factor GrpE [Alphaproteobacteria bacterium]